MKKLPTLTVFTPTFNRAHTLHLCYESLKRQTCKDFIWLIIDDGSSDDTQTLVNGWIEEGIIPIQYHYQSNQGMHGAHNTAYQLVETELNVCIDSDDYLADDAVEKIIDCWKRHGHDSVAGIVGLDATPDGAIIGTRMPEHLKTACLNDLYARYHVRGDKKLVYRSDITRKIPPYPRFEGEKYCPLNYKYILIDQHFPLIVLNEVLCHVEYREDGSSMNMFRQYVQNPRGFSFYRKTAMRYAPVYTRKFRESIHYVSSNLMLRNPRFLIESPCKWTTFLAILPGVLLYAYIWYKNRPGVYKVTSVK